MSDKKYKVGDVLQIRFYDHTEFGVSEGVPTDEELETDTVGYYHSEDELRYNVLWFKAVKPKDDRFNDDNGIVILKSTILQERKL
jgi:hypothetical protein